MSINILTQEDLQKFKKELFAELTTHLSQFSSTQQKKWLKSWEVQQMLGISRGTLRHLFTSGKLPGSQIGGLTFYDYEDIKKLMEGPNKTYRRRLP